MTFPFNLSLVQKKKKREKRDREKRRVCLWGKVCIRRASPLINLLLCGVSVWHRPRGDSCDENKKNENTKQKRERGSSSKREPTPSFLLSNMSTSPHKDPAIIQYRSIQIHAHISKKKFSPVGTSAYLFPHKNKSITWELLCSIVIFSTTKVENRILINYFMTKQSWTVLAFMFNCLWHLYKCYFYSGCTIWRVRVA